MPKFTHLQSIKYSEGYRLQILMSENWKYHLFKTYFAMENDEVSLSFRRKWQCCHDTVREMNHWLNFYHKRLRLLNNQSLDDFPLCDCKWCVIIQCDQKTLKNDVIKNWSC